jgi:hypothetical protein
MRNDGAYKENPARAKLRLTGRCGLDPCARGSNDATLARNIPAPPSQTPAILRELPKSAAISDKICV